MEKAITITGDILKANNQSFSQIEKDQFLDDFVEFLESKSLQFVGMTK